MRITRRQKDDDHITPNFGTEIEDAAIRHRNEVISTTPHLVVGLGCLTHAIPVTDYPEGENTKRRKPGKQNGLRTQK